MRPSPNLFGLASILLFILLFATSVSSQPWDGVIISEVDFQGLQAFKKALNDPKGFLRSWNDSGVGACSGGWEGIKCVKGKVIAIQLPWRGLGGHITQNIGQLTALRKLSLHDNFVGGQIPVELGFLRDLRGVYLFNNRLSGAIPASIGNCLNLQTLDVSNNSLVGSIPSSLSNASNLYRLNVSYNNLSGDIPAGLTGLVSLTFLSLQRNNFSGKLPDTWGGLNSSKIYQLQILNLDHNLFSGTIPVSLSRLQKLSILSLKHNRLNGDIPSSLGNVTSLSHLDLSDNKLTGEIPASLESLTNLIFFNVSDNNLLGQVPVALSEKFNSSCFRGNIQLCGYGTVPCPSFPSHQNPPPPSPSALRGSHRRRKLSTKDIILIIAGIALVLLLTLCCILLCCVLKKRSSEGGKKSVTGEGAAVVGRGAEKPQGEAGGGDIGGKLVHFEGPLAFTADDLLCATAEIMGKSTYGTVYKATLEDGSQVAVKRLRERTAKGLKEFEAEVNILGRIRHPNLLALRAYYMGPKGEKLLVFDYMPKNSLATFLHARGPETPVDWPMRMRIAMGTARGLSYLHNEVNMVHGHLTSNNVLLDENTDPKISDYGLSKLMTSAASANVIATAGALGYRAPELSKLKKANTKTDVYSLGVIMLELLTGKSPSEAMNGVDLPQWVASIVKEEWTNEVFDLELMRDAAGNAGDELLNTLKLALHCVDPSPAARPEVQQVLQQLEEIKPEMACGELASTCEAEEAPGTSKGAAGS